MPVSQEDISRVRKVTSVLRTWSQELTARLSQELSRYPYHYSGREKRKKFQVSLENVREISNPKGIIGGFVYNIKIFCLEHDKIHYWIVLSLRGLVRKDKIIILGNGWVGPITERKNMCGSQCVPTPRLNVEAGFDKTLEEAEKGLEKEKEASSGRLINFVLGK